MRSIKSIQFLLGLFAMCTAGELNPDGLRQLEQHNCGVSKENSFLEGEVLPGSRTWMALIRTKREDNFEKSCTGTLITDQFVLSVAHCVNGVKISEVQVILTADANFEIFDVENIIIHENYTGDFTKPYDIALIKLKRKVEIKEHNSPICLPVNATLASKATTQKTLLHTVWHNDKLLELIVDHVANKQCGSLTPIISENHICYNETSKSLCKGTSGNPISSLVEYSGEERIVQFGIVSFGSSNCTTSVAINVARLMPWITNVLAKES